MTMVHEIEDASGEGKYTVVARRYRPKTFEELVGQDTVAHALLRAMETHRVGHAYLFTGARGVGKTSTARIFAKALNASEDGSGHFDPNGEVAVAIDSGEDMDVIEIDGASNRGIDEIRQLRANASIRPSRSRFKIYIIDEVHMLTTAAFNALLKTLEEPPGHVKFIFCTTDPEKIPITVLSRCQRFDFPPVQSDQILGRLRFICDNEGTEADEEALRLIARRAAGSMRDSQSLLEQLLSFGGKKITVDDVHAMLGTADESRLAAFAKCLIERNASGSLVELDQAMAAGVDPGQLAEQLLGYLRDMMAMAIGGPTELMRTANPNSADALREAGKAWGTMTLLSALQLLDETVVRMKHSVQSRILLEVALVQICNLQDLQSLADVIKGLASHRAPHAPVRATATVAAVPPLASSASAASPSAAPRPLSAPGAAPVPPATTAQNADSKKKEERPEVAMPSVATPVMPVRASLPAPAVPHASLSVSEPAPSVVALANPKASLLALFQATVGGLEGIVQQAASMALEITEHPEHHWRVHLAREAKFAIDRYRVSENATKIVSALREALGHDVTLEWLLTDRPMPIDSAKTDPTNQARSESVARPTVPQNQKIRDAMTHPLIKRFLDLFEGQVMRVDEPAPLAIPVPKVVLKEADGDSAEAEETLSSVE